VTWFVAGIVAASGLCLAAPALAQTASGRPYRGVFGGGQEGRESGQTLDVVATLIQAYDDNLFADGSRVGQAGIVHGGFFTFVGADAAYNRRGERVQFGFTGRSAVRYFNEAGIFASVGHSVAAGLGAELSRRWRLSLNQTAAYSPSYLQELFAATITDTPLVPATGTAVEYITNDSESYSYATNAALTRTLGPRSSLRFAADYRFVDFVGGTQARGDLTTYGGRAHFSRNTTRNTNLRAGYRYRATEYAQIGAGVTVEHGVDVGVDYARPLSATRRATFAFQLGSAVIDVPAGGIGGRPAGQYYRLTGDAKATYQINRTWEARAAYRRGFEYVAEFPDPVFSDAVSGYAGGALSRRFHLSLSGGYSSGRPTAFRATRTFDTYTGTVRLQHATGRRIATMAEYVYYYYDFRQSGVVPLGMPPFLQRNSIRVGAILWIPAIGR
jgi:hypothetical protein